MKRLESILVVQPGTMRVTGMPGLVTLVRRRTPEYTLALLSAICGFVLPDCHRYVLSLRKPGDEETCSVRKILSYGDHELKFEVISSTPQRFLQRAQGSDVALVSATFTCEAYATVQAIQELKLLNPALTVIVGGTDARSRPEFYLGRGADIVFLGAAETNLPALLRCLDEHSDLSEVPNVAWKSSHDKIAYSCKADVAELPPLSVETMCTPALMEEPLFCGTDLHEGPPPPGVSSRSVYMRTSIGCRPGNCGFCTTPFKTGGPTGYCVLSSSELTSLLCKVTEHDVHTLQVIDDNFLAREDMPGGESNIFSALEMMKRFGFAWEFANGLQLSRLLRGGQPRWDLVNALFSPLLDSNARIVGGYRAFVPFETALRGRRPGGYHRWSKMKGLGLEEAIAIIEAFDNAGVSMLSLGVMIGFPDDTMRDMEETVEGMKVVERTIRSLNRQRGARGLPPIETHWDIVIYMLLPGTRDYQRYRHRVLFGDDYETAPELLNFQTAAYWPDNFTPWELTEIRAQIAREFEGVDIATDDVGITQHAYKALG